MKKWTVYRLQQLRHILSFWRGPVLLLVLFVPTVAMAVEGNFCGKYRGIAVDIVDPLFQGRVEVQVPAVFGPGVSLWALPNVPFGRVRLPEVGDIVWVEFEACDPNLPVWEGTPVVHCERDRNGVPRNCRTGQ